MSKPKNTENIKFSIPRPITPVIKPPMYRSIFSNSVKTTYKTNRDCHRTMGYAEVPLKSPTQFLKKNTRKVTRPFVEKTTYLCPVKSAPQLHGTGATKKPWKRSRDEVPKNFIQMNIIDVMRKVPPLPKHRVQDTRNGHVIVLNEAGLEPKYVLNKNYGKMPKYIIKMHNDMKTAKRLEIEKINASKPLSPLRLVTPQERLELIKAQEIKMDKLNTEFLLLPIITDTISKVRRKTHLERTIKDMEDKIDLLNRKKVFYVRQDA
uniref:Enkurin n=1 Tax=Sipha flava TaxID=143950 RepID=A0A2S2QQB4_9HEMI